MCFCYVICWINTENDLCKKNYLVIMEEIMKISTKNFGEVEISENDIITFEQPIFGFDEYTKYIVLMDDSLNGEFIWLQSVDEPDLCFVLANPDNLSEKYSPHFTEDVKSIIGEKIDEVWLVMVIADDFGQSTVNMRSPIIMNLAQRKAAQIILEDNYPLRYKLFESEKEEKK